MGRGAAPLQTSAQVFEHFPAPGNPGRLWRRMLMSESYYYQHNIIKTYNNNNHVIIKYYQTGINRQRTLKINAERKPSYPE